MVPGRVRGAHGADPAGRRPGAPVRRARRRIPADRCRRRGRGPVRPRWPVLGRLGQRGSGVAGPLPARHRLGPGCVPRPKGAGPDARRWCRGHRGTGPVGRVPGQHGRRQRRRHLEPQPAHARRRDVRHRPGRPGAAPAGTAGAVDAPTARLGRGRHGQPVGDDLVPLAPDRLPGGHGRRAGLWPAARPAHGSGERHVDRGAGRLAPGVRRRARTPVAGVPARRTGTTAPRRPGRRWRRGARRPTGRP